MATKLIVLVILLLVSIPVFAQSVDTAWVRRYNGIATNEDEARGIAIDAWGNVLVTGCSYGDMTTWDYATIKYYPNGDTAWVRRYNGPANAGDYAFAIDVDDSGFVYATGTSAGIETDYDYATIKYYPNGDTAWLRRYNDSANSGDIALALAVDGAGNVCVTGSGKGIGTFSEYITIKYWSNGDTDWVRTYNGPAGGSDTAYAIAVDDSGGVYVTGVSYGGSGTDCDYATIKYKPNGDTSWVRRYNGPGNGYDQARSLAVDGSGNVYVTGGSIGSGTNEDYATIKYYPNGDTAWVRRYDGQANGSDEAYAIALDSSNNVYVTGYSDSTGTYQDYATIKYDSSGNELWVKKYNGPPGNGSDFAYDIAVDGSNNAYVTGMSGGGPSSLDYATVKYYPNGDVAWVTRYNGPGNVIDYASAIALDDSGNVCVTGLTDRGGSNQDYATIKYVQFLCGDANKDGVVDVGDVVYLINYLFKGGPAPVPIVKAGDASCDGVVDVGDIVYLINYLFKNGPEPCC